MNKTIQELIADPDCNRQCPLQYRKGRKPEGEPCCCFRCGNKHSDRHWTGRFADGELTGRVADGIITQEEADYVQQTLDSGKMIGAYDKSTGCKLERRMRPMICLEWKCVQDQSPGMFVYEGPESVSKCKSSVVQGGQ